MHPSWRLRAQHRVRVHPAPVAGHDLGGAVHPAAGAWRFSTATPSSPVGTAIGWPIVARGNRRRPRGATGGQNPGAARLGAGHPEWQRWKPKGMRWGTFERLTAEHDAFVNGGGRGGEARWASGDFSRWPLPAGAAGTSETTPATDRRCSTAHTPGAHSPSLAPRLSRV